MSKITYTYLIGLVLALFATSCTDELAPMTSNEVGKDVIVKVPIELPGMEIKSRADLYDYQINHIESVWIRTYAATGSGAATMGEWKKIDASTITLHEPQLVEDLATKSGPTYIVAVANVTNAKGVKKDDQSLTLTSLATLLDEADSWDKFLNIAVATPSEYYDVNEPPTPLVMAGCFLADSDTHPDISGWQSTNYNFKAHDISATDPSQLKGTIHLRRVVSQMTFNLIPGPGIKITPNSYRVVNVPVYSWLYERDSTDGKSANFGDGAENADDAKNYYKTTNLYPHNNFEECEIGTTKDCYKFSFWQAENKHTGNAEKCTEYNHRQIKTGTATNALFTSLTGDTWTPNNMASYVIINCNIDHDGQIKVDNDGQIGQGNKEVYRSGNADYIIHLGFLGDNAADFNAYRNTKYTYNVYINGIDKIRVEAYNENKDPDKDTNGVEGLVTDIDNPTYMLDCHYHSYNIQLTETDLTNFGFIITTYDSGIQHTYQDIDFEDGKEPNDYNPQYLSWVELRPTTDENTLAEYKPRTGGDGKTFNLLDASRDGLTSDQKSTSGWYTVFVNEYTYGGLDGKEEDTDWRRYVNQPSRRFYIRVTRKISPDGHSIYATSKYAGIQRSIQTYYSEIDYPTTGGVLGLEHENEVFGLNVGRNYTYAASDVNGRYNVWCWLNGINTDGTEPSKGPASKKWDDVIVPTKMQHIYAVDDKQGINTPAHDVTLSSLIAIEKVDNNIDNKDMLPQGNTSDVNHWLEAINACMNRNRDNNGNGTIEPEELRWYVPAKSKYLRMILGKNALTTPLTNYDGVSQLPSGGSKDEKDEKVAIKDCTRLMNFTSDGHAIMSFNGTSSSNWVGANMSDIASTPWNVRCVRNLGTDLSTITKEDKTVAAYVHDEPNRTVSMKYYGVNAYRRAEMFSGNGTTDGTMPVHIINETRYNRPFQKFQYSEGRYQLNGDKSRYDGALYYESSNPYNIVRVTEYINQNPCKEIYGDGWRLPNISELSIMRNIGLFDDFYTYTGTGQYINRAYLLSCTKTYYDSKGTGYVLTSDTERNFLGVVYDNTVEILANAKDNQSSYYTHHLYFRCVRDLR